MRRSSLEDAGQEREHAPDVSRTAKAAFPLLDWGPPGRIDDEATDAREDYGYDASWQLLERLHTEIGDDGMRAVIRAAEAETIPYVGVGEPEPLPGDADWHRFLDLLEEVGGSKTATDLFTTWVVEPTEQSALQARASARQAYASLLDEGNGWLPPILVRSPMAKWDWATARVRIADAQAVLDCGTDWRPRRRPRGSPRRPALRRSTNTRPSRSTRRPRSATRSWTRCMRWWRRQACSRRPRDPFTQWGLDGVTQPEAQLSAAQSGVERG